MLINILSDSFWTKSKVIEPSKSAKRGDSVASVKTNIQNLEVKPSKLPIRGATKQETGVTKSALVAFPCAVRAVLGPSRITPLQSTFDLMKYDRIIIDLCNGNIPTFARATKFTDRCLIVRIDKNSDLRAYSTFNEVISLIDRIIELQKPLLVWADIPDVEEIKMDFKLKDIQPCLEHLDQIVGRVMSYQRGYYVHEWPTADTETWEFAFHHFFNKYASELMISTFVYSGREHKHEKRCTSASIATNCTCLIEEISKVNLARGAIARHDKTSHIPCFQYRHSPDMMNKVHAAFLDVSQFVL